jgi:uncharacterized integral membrane protein
MSTEREVPAIWWIVVSVLTGILIAAAVAVTVIGTPPS